MAAKRRTNNKIECFDCLKPSCAFLNKTLTTLNCKECKEILEKNIGFEFKDLATISAAEKEDAIMDAAGNDNQFNLWMSLWVQETNPLPTTAAQKLNFFTEKYDKKTWVADRDYADACKLTHAARKVPSSKIRGFGSENLHEIDVKSLKNPFQMNTFGPYQNLHNPIKSPSSPPQESNFSQPSFAANFTNAASYDLNVSADKTFTIPLKKKISLKSSLVDNSVITEPSVPSIQPPPQSKTDTGLKLSGLYSTSKATPTLMTPILTPSNSGSAVLSPTPPHFKESNLSQPSVSVEDKYAIFRTVEGNSSSSIFSNAPSATASHDKRFNVSNSDFFELRDTRIGGMVTAKDVDQIDDDGFGDFQSSANTESKPQDLLHQDLHDLLKF